MALRVHLESLARQDDVEASHRLANPPPLHPLVAHIWTYYADLSQTRQTGGMGPSRLSRLEIQAWERDEGVRLERWERRAVMAIDALHLSIMNAPDKG